MEFPLRLPLRYEVVQVLSDGRGVHGVHDDDRGDDDDEVSLKRTDSDPHLLKKR